MKKGRKGYKLNKIKIISKVKMKKLQNTVTVILRNIGY